MKPTVEVELCSFQKPVIFRWIKQLKNVNINVNINVNVNVNVNVNESPYPTLKTKQTTNESYCCVIV